jgi:hypothetical protein
MYLDADDLPAASPASATIASSRSTRRAHGPFDRPREPLAALRGFLIAD